MRLSMALKSCALAIALATVALPGQASITYQFAGSVNLIPAALVGGGIALGDPVYMTITLGAAVPDADPAASVGVFSGAITSWGMTIGSFSTSGDGGDVMVCDSPVPGQDNCGSANPGYGWWSGVWKGKDSVRFVTKHLTSPAIMLNGYTQSCVGSSTISCGNANVYDDMATALSGTDIPVSLEPGVFGSSTNNGRVGFGPGFVGFTVAVVPEPSSCALVTAALAGLGFAARRRRA